MGQLVKRAHMGLSAAGVVGSKPTCATYILAFVLSIISFLCCTCFVSAFRFIIPHYENNIMGISKLQKRTITAVHIPPCFVKSKVQRFLYTN